MSEWPIMQIWHGTGWEDIRHWTQVVGVIIPQLSWVVQLCAFESCVVYVGFFVHMSDVLSTAHLL